jgi:hypothetical protein
MMIQIMSIAATVVVQAAPTQTLSHTPDHSPVRLLSLSHSSQSHNLVDVVPVAQSHYNSLGAASCVVALDVDALVAVATVVVVQVVGVVLGGSQNFVSAQLMHVVSHAFQS